MSENLNRISGGSTDPGILRHRITSSTDEQFVRWFKQALGEFKGNGMTEQKNGADSQGGGTQVSSTPNSDEAAGTVLGHADQEEAQAAAMTGVSDNMETGPGLPAVPPDFSEELVPASLQTLVRPEAGAAPAESAQTQSSAQAAPEHAQCSPRSVHVTPGEDGMNIWIRDYAMGADLGQKVLSVFRRMFARSGNRIATMVLNGKTVWRAAGDENQSPVSPTGGIDRKY